MKSTKIYIDIETIPAGDPIAPCTLTPPGNMKKIDTIETWYREEAPQIAEEQYRKRALDSMQGQILVIAFAVNNDEPIAIHSLIDEGFNWEGSILQDLENFGKNYIEFPIVWIGHNAVGFDMLWLWRRAIKYDLPWLSQNIKLDRYKGNVHDTMIMWGGGNFNNFSKLDDIAKFLGIAGKTEGVDGSKVYDLYLEGKIDEITEYCCNDVRMVRDVYQQISFGM
jgi:3'-5' exonuclease